ncbi:MAG: tyrosine-type recombinase/integrase [Dehalococcoidia bacterium]
MFSLQAEGRSRRTHEYYAKLLSHLLRYCREQDWPDQLAALDSNRIREFLSYTGSRKQTYNTGNGSLRTSKAKPSTAWPYFKAIRRFGNWAVEEGLLQENPARKIHFKQPRPAQVQPYNEDELRQLLAVCDLDIRPGAHFTDIRNKAMILLFLDGALRLSELAAIEVTDLSLPQRLVRVMGKGDKTAFCPFSPATAKTLVLCMAVRERRAKSNALWITEEGTAFTADGLGSWFTRLKKRAGILGPGGVHRLRHSSALQYLRSSKDSFLLQLFLRHEDLAMSRRYTQALKVEEALEAHRNEASPVEGLRLN